MILDLGAQMCYECKREFMVPTMEETYAHGNHDVVIQMHCVNCGWIPDRPNSFSRSTWAGYDAWYDFRRGQLRTIKAIADKRNSWPSVIDELIEKIFNAA